MCPQFAVRQGLSVDHAAILPRYAERFGCLTITDRRPGNFSRRLPSLLSSIPFRYSRIPYFVAILAASPRSHRPSGQPFCP